MRVKPGPLSQGQGSVNKALGLFSQMQMTERRGQYQEAKPQVPSQKPARRMWGVRPAGARLDPRRPLRAPCSQTRPSSPIPAGPYPTMGPGPCRGLQPWFVSSPPRSPASQPWPAQASSPELLAPRQQPTRKQGRGSPGLWSPPPPSPSALGTRGQVPPPSRDGGPRVPPLTPAPFKGWVPHKLPGPTQGDTGSERWSPGLGVGW